MAEQQKLVDVPVSDAQREAERYSELAFDVKSRQERLKAQGEQVIEAMEMIGQRKMSFKDGYGVRHTFEIVNTPEKLKYTKKGEKVA